MPDPCPAPTIQTAEQLVAAMRIPPLHLDPKTHRDKSRDVYEAYERGKFPTGQFYLTYGNGVRVARQAVEDAVKRGLIVPTWPNATGSWSLPKLGRGNRKLYEARMKRDA